MRSPEIGSQTSYEQFDSGANDHVRNPLRAAQRTSSAAALPERSEGKDVGWNARLGGTRAELRATFQIAGSEQLLAPHDVDDVYDCARLAVEDATGRLDDLAITPSLRLKGPGTHTRMIGQMIDMAEDALYECFCRFQIVQRDVISDCIEVTERRL